MSFKCVYCDELLTLEKERIDWYEELSRRNIELHKKIREQNDMIVILHEKLARKTVEYYSNYITMPDNPDSLIEGEKVEGIDYLNFMDVVEKGKDSQEALIRQNETQYLEAISYLEGLVDFFREALFQEFRVSNAIKQNFNEKLARVTSSCQGQISGVLRIEEKQLREEFKLRYKSTIEKSNEEIERLDQLIQKSRKHNQQLYNVIRENINEHKTEMCFMQSTVNKLKKQTGVLKEKNEYLRTQIKLKVEGCQNDIYETMKRIKKYENSKF